MSKKAKAGANAPLPSPDPSANRVIAEKLRELTEANEALRANEESLRQLLGRLFKLQDEERRRIARDLHDITGQKLAVQSMALSQIMASKSMALDAETHRVLSECDLLNKQIGEEIRTLSYLFHPPLLDELGLSSAVKWYAEAFERRTGIRVEVDVYPELIRLPPDIEMAVFRVIQESLTNIERDSGSSAAFVRVRATANAIEATIGDSGMGIHRDIVNPTSGKVAPTGVGIQVMKERVRQLNGELEITSRSNRGTVVTATIPLSPAIAIAAQGSSKAHQPNTTRME
jgi:signal transduction histidine kinase